MYCRPGETALSAVTDDTIDLCMIGRNGHEARFEFKLGRPEERYSWPRIPGFVYRHDTLEVVVEFHREHRSADGLRIGISLDGSSITVPDAGLRFQSYWVPDAGDAVLAGPAGWRFVTFGPEDQCDHEHDVFDWAKIGPRFITAAWYNSDHDWWATPENFEKFVRDDVLGWRADPDQAKS